MPFSVEALRHYYDLLDQALERGTLTLVFDSPRALAAARHRLNAARSHDRRLNAERPIDDPRQGISIYDELTIRRDDLKLVIKREGVVPGLVKVE